jgi:hypothetical protein
MFSVSNISNFFQFSISHFAVRTALSALPLTGWRLGAAAGFTHYLSNPHFPPPLRQTARYLLAFYRDYCRYHYRFHYIVGLYSIFGTVLNFNTLSGCTLYSIRLPFPLHCQSGGSSLSVRYSTPLLCRLVLHFRYGTQFHYIVCNVLVADVRRPRSCKFGVKRKKFHSTSCFLTYLKYVL